jgi:hypothetical protein
MKGEIDMGKRAKLLIIAASVAAVLALSIGSVAVAASPNNTNDNGVCCGQGAGFGKQGICSDTVCKLLGLTAEQIQAQRHEGKSLVQIAATKGVSEQQLVEAILAARKAEIQARVTAGTLTQERANLMLQQMEQNVVRAVNRTTIGPPEWAGAKGAGQGASTGQMRNQGQDARGTGYGEPGLGTGPVNMHKWGKSSR